METFFFPREIGEPLDNYYLACVHKPKVTLDKEKATRGVLLYLYCHNKKKYTFWFLFPEQNGIDISSLLNKIQVTRPDNRNTQKAIRHLFTS